MVMSNLQALSLIAAAQEVVSTGGDAPIELRCQYPSKRCDHVRTTKRGGGLHRLCVFHRQRANKNQWHVDQRRRLRRDHDGALVLRTSSNAGESPVASPRKVKPTLLSPSSSFGVAEDETIMDALDMMDMESICASLDDVDLEVLQAIFLDGDDDDEVSMVSDLSDDYLTMDWTF